MLKQPTQAEIDEARHNLELAIYKDGEGSPTQFEIDMAKKFGRLITRKSYYEDTGQYLWTPKLSDFNYWWSNRAFTYTMSASDSQVRAYHRLGETVVTHNGAERHKLSVRGWY